MMRLTWLFASAALIGAAVPSPALAGDASAAIYETVEAAQMRRYGELVDTPVYKTSRDSLGWQVGDWLAKAFNTITLGMFVGEERPCVPGVDQTKCINGGAGYGGGGASFTYDLPDGYCNGVQYRVDEGGLLMVPTISLVPGKDMTWGEQVFAAQNVDVPSAYTRSDNFGGSVLYALHRRNSAFTDPRWWMGVWKQSGTGSTTNYFAASQKFTDNGGITRNRVTHQWASTSTLFEQFKGNQCPNTQATGGEFDFYYQGSSSNTTGGFQTCIWYAFNFSISPSGYAYPTEVAGPTLSELGAAHPANKCPASRQLIAKVADKILEKYRLAKGQAHDDPVTVADVRECGDTVTIEDLAQPLNPNSEGCETPATPPAGDPTPTPTSTGSPGSGGGSSGPVDVNWGDAPNVADPDLTAPSFGWWPEMPAINIATNANCPTWSFEAFSQTFVIDSHCPLIESNRAIISALMIILFTIGAGRVILEA